MSYERVGDVQVDQGDLAGALKSYQDSLAIFDRLAKSDPGNAGWQRDLSTSNERLGDIFLAQGNLPAALEQYRASLERMVPIRDRDPSNADLQRFTSVTLEKVGDVQMAQGDLAGALKSYQDSLAIVDRLAKSDPGNAGWQRDLSVSYEKIGDVQVAQGDLCRRVEILFGRPHVIRDRLAKSAVTPTMRSGSAISSVSVLQDRRRAKGAGRPCRRAEILFRQPRHSRPPREIRPRQRGAGSAISRCRTSRSATCKWRRAILPAR